MADPTEQTTGHEWDGIEERDTPLPRWWLEYRMRMMRSARCHGHYPWVGEMLSFLNMPSLGPRVSAAGEGGAAGLYEGGRPGARAARDGTPLLRELRVSTTQEHAACQGRAPRQARGISRHLEPGPPDG